ncbi:MAG TPA: hypothetical protein VM430_09470, partial [Microbacterium sp.]|nr:hypothetical protein [Microbacterium sp.]
MRGTIGRLIAGQMPVLLLRPARPVRSVGLAVALDSLYPGWDGLADGVEAARELILRPHARGLIGVWERWDWELSAP